MAACSDRPGVVDQAAAQPSCPARKPQTPAVEASAVWSPSMAPASPCSRADLVSFAIQGWTVNEKPSTLEPLMSVGWHSCSVDRLQDDKAACLPRVDRPVEEERAPFHNKARESPRRVRLVHGTSRRPPVSAQCRQRWPPRGARLASGAYRARGAVVHLSGCLSFHRREIIQNQDGPTFAQRSSPRSTVTGRPILIYG